MAKHWLEYNLHLSDQAEVELRQSQRDRWNMPRNDLATGVLRTVSLFTIPLPGTGRLICGPERASREYSNAVLVKYGEARPANPPYITSPWLFPVSSPDRLPTNKDTFEKKSGGWFGISFLFGRTDEFTWVGRYVYTPSTTPTDAGTVQSLPEQIKQRRWADGFELPTHGEGSSAGETAISTHTCRDASRHPGGMGLRICEPLNAVKRHNTNEFRTGLSPTSGWERLYVRVGTRPSAPFEFWQAENNAGGLNGVCLQLLPSGALAVNDISNAGVRTLLATSAVLDLNKWYRLDMIHCTGNDPSGARFELWINRSQIMNITGFSASGWGGPGVHVSSLVGNDNAATLGVCIDLDDWICADRPASVANSLGSDWLNGSQVVVINPNAFGAAQTADWGANKTATQLMGVPAVDQVQAMDFSHTGAVGIIEVTTDVAFQVGTLPRTVNGGIVALTIGLFNSTAPGSGNGTLSLARNGGAYVNTVLSQPHSGSMNWDNVGYMPSGLATPEALTALSMKYAVGTGATQKNVRSFCATAEVLGVFGEEDFSPTSISTGLLPPTPPAGIHNGPYDRSPWAYTGVAPMSPTIIHSGTYVGNSGVTELRFRAPVNWLHIRRVTAAIENGTKWVSSMRTGKRGHEQPYSPETLYNAVYQTIIPAPGAGEDIQEAECVITIAGDQSHNNASGVTYQYVAFIDPGMRFSLNDAVLHPRGTADHVTSLIKPAFLGEAGFFYQVSSQGSTNVADYFKGRGHATASISILNGAEIAAAVSFQAGQVTTQDAFVPAAGASGVEEIPFALFRRDDGSGDPGIPDVLQIIPYTGDGGASRTIALAGTSKRPLMAWLVPHNGAAFIRDPSHTGTTSHRVSTGGTLTLDAATGITGGGPGTVSVGSLGNTNAIGYELFVFMGGDAACNNGFSCDGEFIPVEPIEPADWPGDDDPLPDDDDQDDLEPDGEGGGGGDTGDGGGGDPGGDDFGTACVDLSEKVCNQALSHIGISELITDIVADTRVEATMCRLHYEDAVNESLREFPWDFATRYANLVYVAGSEEFGSGVNDDWSYSYRVPSDCLFPRRLVRPENRREFDPDPPPFRQTGADTTGRLLLSNWRDAESTDEAPTAQLEYTYRPSCAAGQGDALYRQALAWLLAHKLAPSLSRNKVTAADCWAMYLHTLSRASTVNARAQQQTTKQGDAEWTRARGEGTGRSWVDDR